MSIKLMAAAWELPIPSTEKMVLLCLCDFSNDHGTCWPAVGTIAGKCSKGERTVQKAIQWLVDGEFLTLETAPGRTHMFHLNPRKICAPVKSAPPQNAPEPPQLLTETPAEVAPKPLEPSLEPLKNNKRPAVGKPNGVSGKLWRDFLEVRKAKRAPLTETAMAGIEREVAKAGWSIEAALTECVERGWQAFRADWIKGSAHGADIRGRSGGRAPSNLASAIDRELGQ